MRLRQFGGGRRITKSGGRDGGGGLRTGRKKADEPEARTNLLPSRSASSASRAVMTRERAIGVSGSSNDLGSTPPTVGVAAVATVPALLNLLAFVSSLSFFLLLYYCYIVAIPGIS